MNCNDSCCINTYPVEGESQGFFSVHDYKAKKEYSCGECSKTIEVGQKYRRITASFEGEISTFRTCSSCADIADKLFCDGGELGRMWEDFDDFVAMTYDDGKLEKWVNCCSKILTDGRDVFFERVQQFIDNGLTPLEYWNRYWGIQSKTSADWAISLFNTMYTVGKRVWWHNGDDLVLTKTNLPAFQANGRALVSISACPKGPVNLLSIMPEEVLS